MPDRGQPAEQDALPGGLLEAAGLKKVLLVYPGNGQMIVHVGILPVDKIEILKEIFANAEG